MTYSCGLLHTDEQRQDDQLEPIYNSSVPIQDVALKSYRERWTIEKGGGRGLGRSVLAARHGNDDDDDDMKVPNSFITSSKWFMPFPMAPVRSETQTTLFRIWTRVADSISYDDNRCANCASKKEECNFKTILPSLSWNIFDISNWLLYCTFYKEFCRMNHSSKCKTLLLCLKCLYLIIEATHK